LLAIITLWLELKHVTMAFLNITGIRDSILAVFAVGERERAFHL